MNLKLLIREPAALAFVVLPLVAAVILVLLGSTNAIRVRALEREVASQRQRLVAGWGADPAPTAETFDAVLSHVHYLRNNLSQVLPPHFEEEMGLTRESAHPEGLFFEIIDYTERVSALATEKSIGFSSTLKFGFSDIVQAGGIQLEGLPQDRRGKVIETLSSQLRLLDHVMAVLLAAEPDQIVNVRRAIDPQDDGQHWRREPEVFVDDSASGRELPEWLICTSAEVIFEGQTDVLRDFLNGMASLRLTAIVRELKIEAVAEASRVRPSAGSRLPAGLASGPFDRVSTGSATEQGVRTQESIPIVNQNVSRFFLRVDLYEVRSTPLDEGHSAYAEVLR